MTVDFMVRYNDFAGGDMGVLDPALANGNTFTAENMVIYPSGLIGPRAGLKKLPITGLPDHTLVPGPLGFTAWDDKLLIVLDRIFEVPMAGGAAGPWAAYPGAASPPTTEVRFVNGSEVDGTRRMYSLLNGVLYKHVGAGSITAITTQAPLADIVRWGDWFVGIDRGRRWRIWFSKLDDSGSDFDTWPALNYYDVGGPDPIRCLKPIYNTLYVGKKEGWWAISGVLGKLASIRDVCIGNGPIDCKFTSVTTDNRIVYWPVHNVPAWFNGATVTLETQQIMSPRNLSLFTGDAVTVTPTARRIALAGDDPAGTLLYVWQNGTWQHHRTSFRLGAIAPSDVRQGSDLPMHVVYAAQRPTTIGDPAIIVTLQHEMNRPAHTDDQYAAPIDAGESELLAGSFNPVAWFDGQGRQTRVRWVQVQFRKWASGVPNSYNKLTLRVEALGPYGAGSEYSEPMNWIEAAGPAGRAPRGGADESWRVNVGEQGWGNGFRLHFDEVAGVAIREIVVGVNLRTERT